MNADDLRRRLMTDPGRHQADAERARAEGGEAASVVSECEDFERLLDEALYVEPPTDLEARLQQIPFRAGRQGDRDPAQDTATRGPGTMGWLAIAASLALALAVTVFTLRDNPAQTNTDLSAFLAQHWAHDGVETLAAALSGPSEAPDRVQALLAGFGVQLEPELLGDVQLTKVCPTPDGAGAHLILDTDDGPLTVYYMPRTQVPGSGESYALADGLHATVYNVERGSLALVTERNQNLPELARSIANRIIFADDRSL